MTRSGTALRCRCSSAPSTYSTQPKALWFAHPQYHKPELLATGPNQVWSWDITKLLGPAKWSCFYLYVIMGIFSRYVAGGTLAQQESGQDGPRPWIAVLTAPRRRSLSRCGPA
jgi:transposase InsO family protein